MMDSYRRASQQPLLRYERPPLVSSLGQKRRPNPTGILKSPFGLHRAPNEQARKTLRFDVSTPLNPASLEFRRDDRYSPFIAATGETSSTKPKASTYTSDVVKEERADSSAKSASSTSSRPPSGSPAPEASSDLSSSGVVVNDTSTSLSATASSTSPATRSSLVLHSITEGILRHFRNYGWGVKGGATDSASSRPWSFTGFTSTATERWQGPPLSRRMSLLTFLAALLIILLAGMSTKVYSTLSDGSKGRTVHVPLQDEAAGVAPLEGDNEQISSYWIRSLPEDHYEKEDHPHFPNKDLHRRDAHKMPKKPNGQPKEDAEQAEAYTPYLDMTSSDVDVWQGDKDTLTWTGTNEQEDQTTEYQRVEEILNNSKLVGNTFVASKKRGPSRCGAFAFNYCLSPRREFFYKPSVNACVEAANGNVGVCTRGRNRFTSKKSCHQECVEKRTRGEPCVAGAVFQQCDTADVRGKWWHYDGRSCLLWNFTSGFCPSHESDVFPSRSRCVTQCASRPRKHLCRAAVPDVCHSDRLRFPYFVVAQPVVRCLKVSSANYLGHRCLTGPNRFDSPQACEKACITGKVEEI